MIWGPILFSLRLCPLRHFLLMACYHYRYFWKHNELHVAKTENTLSCHVYCWSNSVTCFSNKTSCLLLKHWQFNCQAFRYTKDLIRLLLLSIFSLAPCRMLVLKSQPTRPLCISAQHADDLENLLTYSGATFLPSKHNIMYWCSWNLQIAAPRTTNIGWSEPWGLYPFLNPIFGLSTFCSSQAANYSNYCQKNVYLMANPTMQLKPLTYLKHCSHFGLSECLTWVTLPKH